MTLRHPEKSWSDDVAYIMGWGLWEWLVEHICLRNLRNLCRNEWETIVWSFAATTAQKSYKVAAVPTILKTAITWEKNHSVSLNFIPCTYYHWHCYATPIYQCKMCYWSTHTHPFTIKFCMYLFLSISIWIILFGNPFLSETWGFQMSLCRNPVSNSRTPKTLLNGNCSETQKIKFVVPDYPVIYTGWI